MELLSLVDAEVLEEFCAEFALAVLVAGIEEALVGAPCDDNGAELEVCPVSSALSDRAPPQPERIKAATRGTAKPRRSYLWPDLVANCRHEVVIVRRG